MSTVAVSLLLCLLETLMQPPTVSGTSTAGTEPAPTQHPEAVAAPALCETLMTTTPASLRAAQSPRVHVELQALPDSKIKRGLALARIAAPADVVFRIVTDYEQFEAFFPLVRESTLQGQREQTALVYQIIDLPFPLTNRRFVIGIDNDHGVTHRGHRCYQSRWQYEKGSGNISENYGHWEVLEDGSDHSLVAYLAYIDPGGKIPTWTHNWSTRKALPRMMQALRSEAQRRMPR